MKTEIQLDRLAIGFKDLVLKDLIVAGKERTSLEAILLADQAIQLTGIMSYMPVVDPSSSHISTHIDERMIRSLPIP